MANRSRRKDLNREAPARVLRSRGLVRLTMLLKATLRAYPIMRSTRLGIFRDAIKSWKFKIYENLNDLMTSSGAIIIDWPYLKLVCFQIAAPTHELCVKPESNSRSIPGFINTI
jgi:hypothetical protein